MKRRITSLAMLVLSLLMAAPVLADELSLIERGDLVTTPEAEQFYVIQGNGQANQVTWLFDNDGKSFLSPNIFSRENNRDSFA